MGKAGRIELLEVYWPTTGKFQRFSDVAVDQFIETTEGDHAYRKRNLKSVTFQDDRGQDN